MNVVTAGAFGRKIPQVTGTALLLNGIFVLMLMSRGQNSQTFGDFSFCF